MKIKFFLCALTALVLTLPSCADPDKIEVGEVTIQGFRMASASAINIDVGLEVINASGSNAAVTSAVAELRANGVKVAEITLRDKVVAPKRSEGVYTLPLSVHVNGLTGLMMLGNLNAKNLSGWTINARATLRGGWAKKGFQIDDMPLDALLRQLGQDPQTLFDNYNFEF